MKLESKNVITEKKSTESFSKTTKQTPHKLQNNKNQSNITKENIFRCIFQYRRVRPECRLYERGAF